MTDKKKGSAVKKIFGGYPSLIFYIGLGIIVLAVLIGVGVFNSKLEKYLADWPRYGRSAGPKRNKQMAEKCDFVIYNNADENTFMDDFFNLLKEIFEL